MSQVIEQPEFSCISLFIPYVFPKITEEDVARVFKPYGNVSHVDFCDKTDKNGKHYKNAFIHFEFWRDSPANREFQRLVIAGESMKVKYDGEWFWSVLLNKSHYLKEQELAKQENAVFEELDMLRMENNELQSEVQFLTNELATTIEQKQEAELRELALYDEVQILQMMIHNIRERYGNEFMGFGDSDTSSSLPMTPRTPRPRTTFNYDDSDADEGNELEEGEVYEAKRTLEQDYEEEHIADEGEHLVGDDMYDDIDFEKEALDENNNIIVSKDRTNI